MAKTQSRKHDVPCSNCLKNYSVTVNVPTGNREAADAKIFRVLNKRGWDTMRWFCPTCAQNHQKKG